MIEFIQAYSGYFRWLAIFSVLMFAGTLVVVPYLVTRIPEDYFSHTRRERTAFSQHHPVIRIILLLIKNTVGYLVVLLGIILLFLPGQGILTIIAGLILIDFPGKYKLERWLASREKVLKSINWLRRRADKQPLKIR